MDLQRTIVIGAGISGLVVARTLTAAGRNVLILDKGRSVGGRIATRRLSEGSCDHGAQFVTIRSPEFQKICAAPLASSNLLPWCSNRPGAAKRYRGAPSMAAFAKSLAQGLAIELSCEIHSVREDPSGWLIRSLDNRHWIAEAVVLTPPLPQSLKLLEVGGKAATMLPQDLQQLQYDPCFAAMLRLDGPSVVPYPGCYQPQPHDGDLHKTLAWISDNQQKGTSADATTLTLHATASFSVRHFDDDLAVVLQHLEDCAKPWLGSRRVVERLVHCWRYSKPIAPLGSGFFKAATTWPLYFAGDGFLGPSVESAALSGLKAAADLIERTFS